MRSDAVAIVPAGGEARRLGTLGRRGKATLTVGGRTFLDRVCGVLAAEVARVIVVAPAGRVLPEVAVPVEIVADSAPRAGPLAAVRDGLVHAAAAEPPPRLAVLCGCDTPLVVPAVVRLLLSRASAGGARWVLPVVGGHPQPLLSVIAVDLAPVVEATLARGGASLRELVAAVEATAPRAVLRLDPAELRAADPDLASFFDVDTPEDLVAVARRAAEPPPGA